MSAGVGVPAPRPCASCPYRRDVPSGIWDASEYSKLTAYDRDTHAQPLGLFLCHQTNGDDPNARLCAGWVGCHGDQLIALRLAVARGRLPGEVFDYTTDVPLFESGAAAAAHGVAGIDNPDARAVNAIEKVAARRGLDAGEFDR
ncbi:hypothetical protein SEA_BIPPER_81 [Mycobacterium phage Bipper]|uniref:Uncharacterized protein n=1 Tax=Mycobacterium phage Bipper TaxID=1805457 RepID=A0A142F2K9_9CAUD|nr:hypothetical protein KCH39_gp096 [Mycobacterium phage Bipper]AMQ67016.1 hypothetical protein SEA_BIPPER_81 [Mycobacterium phage Bipper]